MNGTNDAVSWSLTVTVSCSSVICPLVCLLLFANVATAQPIRTDGSPHNTIRTAVPFLLIAPDARAGALGDAGVATSSDAYAMHWNAAKYAFAKEASAISLTYTPWLRALAEDVYLSYLSGYSKLTDRQTIATSLKYYSLGNVRFSDGQGAEYLQYRPFECALDAAYILTLSEGMSLGTTFRYIYSGIGAGDYQLGEAFPGRAFAFDVGWYYHRPIQTRTGDADFALGAQLSNLGTRMQYGQQSHFLPMNLRIGTAYTMHLDRESRLMWTLELSKLLVPTEPLRDENGRVVSGRDPDRSIMGAVFGSFGDAPGGLMEELQELRVSAGVEWLVGGGFALRGGYYYTHPQKDDRRYVTVGMGLRFSRFTGDFSYLIATNRFNPLQNTLRVSLGYLF